MKKFITILSILLCSYNGFTATIDYPTTSAQVSSELLPATALRDGNTNSAWSSNSHGAAATTEWAAVWLAGAQKINVVKLMPSYDAVNEALGFPTDFDIYYDNGNGWILAQSYQAFGRPNRSDWVVLPLTTAVNGQAIRIVATKLADDKAGNYVFKLAEMVPAYDVEFENNYRYLGYNGELRALNQIQIGGNVGSESFNPNKFSNWHYDMRGALISPQAGVNKNIYAPSAVKNGASNWNIYFGGWDGTSDGHDRISICTSPDNFATFGPHYVMINNGGWNHVNNLNVAKDAGLFRMYFTTLPYGNPVKNKPAYATSPDGITWTPNTSDDNYLITMSGYPGWAAADVNGGNVGIKKDGINHLFFDNFTDGIAGVHHATSGDGKNFIYQGVALGESARIANDIKEFTYNAQSYYVMMCHLNSQYVWYSVSNDLNSFPATNVLTNAQNANDLYITSVGIVNDNNRCLGILYGAGPTSDLTHNSIFAKWLQKKVIFGSPAVVWGNGELALGPDLIRIAASNAAETGHFQVYDTDGATLLYTTPLLTTRPGDIWQYIGPDNALPVKLISLKVSKEGNSANLNWSTTEEVNSNRFEIQHSMDAKQWEEIGKVASNGDSKIEQHYNFTHLNPSSGTNYYRLKMVDRDATYSYSRIHSIEFDGNLFNVVYPNPVSDRLKLNSDRQITEVVILDQSGKRRVTSSKIESDGLDISMLPDGIYLVQFKDHKGLLYTQRILIGR